MAFPWLLIASVALPVAGAALNIASGKVEDKKLELKVAEKVAEELAKQKDN